MSLSRRAGPLLAAVLAGCGGGSSSGSGEELPLRSLAGAEVVESSGCLSCHEIGKAGKASPGNDLTRVGARLSRAQLEGSLLDPPAGMPSYGRLSAKQRENLVAYLTRLR